ncbi:hypothetical protein ACF1G0_32900 [Streptomyces sp. NPDC013953]|uniref:hypothetical protein n=1 Tax=Streptomyces sp. NPDC013953 TaxID=3364868 RepID=UPI00370185A1
MLPFLTDITPRAVIHTTIVSWHHALHGDASCLGRLIVPTNATAPAIVLSEIAENPTALGISSDFPAAANSAWARLAPLRPGLDPAATTWYAHHGPFSSWDPTGPETLTQVALLHDHAGFHGDLEGHQLLSAPQAQKVLESWGLEPVSAALSRLERA